MRTCPDGALLQGLFGNPLLADASGFYLLKEQAEIDSDALVREATSTKRTRNVVEIFDELSDVLCRVADLVSSKISEFCA